MCRGLQFALFGRMPEWTASLFRFSYIAGVALLASKVLLFDCRLCAGEDRGA